MTMPGTQLLGCQYSYFCTRTASKVSTAGARLLNIDVGERKLLDERADVGTAGPAIRQHTSAYVSIRQHTSAYDEGADVGAAGPASPLPMRQRMQYSCRASAFAFHNSTD